jgi:type I restriction enzyme, S subunit
LTASKRKTEKSLIVNWQTVRLGDIADLLSGGTPSMQRPEYWGGQIPWVSAKDLKGSRINDSILHLTEEGALNGTKLVPENTILCVVRGMSLANEFRISLSNIPVTFNQDLKAICPYKGIDPIFLFYTLFARRNHIKQLAGEASHGTKKLPTEVLQSVEIKLPDFSVQQRIASIASSYDDLIENNRRRIQLLEQSARLLYKEWFVRLRFPGHERVKIKDGVPEGWEKKAINEVCETVGGGTPSTNKPEYWNDGDITWVTPTDVTRNDCLALIGSEKRITEAGLRASSAKLVPPDTILMTSRASVGFFALMENEVCTNQGFINIIPVQDHMRMYLLHNLMYRVEEIRSHAGGATYKEISKSRFRGLNIVVPSKVLLLQFEEMALQLLKQTRVLQKQKTKLTKARDLLLPRLMNGEIAV